MLYKMVLNHRHFKHFHISVTLTLHRLRLQLLPMSGGGEDLRMFASWAVLSTPIYR